MHTHKEGVCEALCLKEKTNHDTHSYGGPENSTHCSFRTDMQIDKKHKQIKKMSSSVWQHKHSI